MQTCAKIYPEQAAGTIAQSVMETDLDALSALDDILNQLNIMLLMCMTEFATICDYIVR